MRLIVKVDKKVKRLNTMAEHIARYVESGTMDNLESLEIARQKIINHIQHSKFHGYAKGGLAVGKPYVLGRSSNTNTGTMAFGISQPGRVCSFITIWESESRPLDLELTPNQPAHGTDKD